jgi:hypothetical protein
VVYVTAGESDEGFVFCLLVSRGKYGVGRGARYHLR